MKNARSSWSLADRALAGLCLAAGLVLIVQSARNSWASGHRSAVSTSRETAQPEVRGAAGGAKSEFQTARERDELLIRLKSSRDYWAVSHRHSAAWKMYQQFAWNDADHKVGHAINQVALLRSHLRPDQEVQVKAILAESLGLKEDLGDLAKQTIDLEVYRQATANLQAGTDGELAKVLSPDVFRLYQQIERIRVSVGGVEATLWPATVVIGEPMAPDQIVELAQIIDDAYHQTNLAETGARKVGGPLPSPLEVGAIQTEILRKARGVLTAQQYKIVSDWLSGIPKRR